MQKADLKGLDGDATQTPPAAQSAWVSGWAAPHARASVDHENGGTLAVDTGAQLPPEAVDCGRLITVLRTAPHVAERSTCVHAPWVNIAEAHDSPSEHVVELA
jgi:hypothetical protein